MVPFSYRMSADLWAYVMLNEPWRSWSGFTNTFKIFLVWWKRSDVKMKKGARVRVTLILENIHLMSKRLSDSEDDQCDQEKATATNHNDSRSLRDHLGMVCSLIIVIAPLLPNCSLIIIIIIIFSRLSELNVSKGPLLIDVCSLISYSVSNLVSLLVLYLLISYHCN